MLGNRQCIKDLNAMSAEAERMRNEMVHILKYLDKDMKLAKENLYSQELAKLRGDEANTLAKEVKVEGKNGLENHDVSQEKHCHCGKLKFKFEASAEEKTKKVVCVTTNTQRPVSSISARQPAA